MGRVVDGRRLNGRTPRGLPVGARFWSKVAVGSRTECWRWLGSIVQGSGYGGFQASTGHRVNAHRWAYIAVRGQVPDGLQLDHLCRNRWCVNPWHLEPVTSLENVRRGQGHGSETRCPYGHPYDDENTYHHRGIRRHCRACRHGYLRAYRQMSPAERSARKAAGLPVVDLAEMFAGDDSQRGAA